MRTWPVRDEWLLVQAAGEFCFPSQEREPNLRRFLPDPNRHQLGRSKPRVPLTRFRPVHG